MKILFLDVDGVLNCHRDYEVYSLSESFPMMVNRRKIDLLEKIIADTDCKIVLSSSWRTMPDGVKLLQHFSDQFEIFDVTPSHGFDSDIKYTCRGAEIQDWLDNNRWTNYAIVDDDGDMLDSQLRHFVQTDPEYGLTPTLAYRITYILNEGPRSL